MMLVDNYTVSSLYSPYSICATLRVLPPSTPPRSAALLYMASHQRTENPPPSPLVLSSSLLVPYS